ncbi:MAG: bacteriohopanetetrol glucosamine biosynthesis glycosyltransferase HpnI, partial [Isosphaeraceae bacterium]
MIVEILAAASGAYQVLATVACLAFSKASRTSQAPAGISILKPVHGVDSALRDAIRSHTLLEGEYELLCGVRPGDP